MNTDYSKPPQWENENLMWLEIVKNIGSTITVQTKVNLICEKTLNTNKIASSMIIFNIAWIIFTQNMSSSHIIKHNFKKYCK